MGECGGEDGELGVGVFVFLWGCGGMVFGVVVSLEKLWLLWLVWLVVVLRSCRSEAGARGDGSGWGGEAETGGGCKSPTGKGE